MGLSNKRVYFLRLYLRLINLSLPILSLRQINNSILLILPFLQRHTPSNFKSRQRLCLSSSSKLPNCRHRINHKAVLPVNILLPTSINSPFFLIPDPL